MAGSRNISDDELRLWRQAMAGVTPLRPRSAVRQKPPGESEPPPVDPPAAPPAVGRKPARPDRPTTQLPHLAPGATPGLDYRTAERLRRGKLAIDARLDLHGLRQGEAHDALIGFVERSYRAGRRTLLVITGKGSVGEDAGVLRSQVPRWLNEPRLRQRIIGLQQATRRHGGEGAFYILLRRMRG